MRGRCIYAEDVFINKEKAGTVYLGEHYYPRGPISTFFCGEPKRIYIWEGTPKISKHPNDPEYIDIFATYEYKLAKDYVINSYISRKKSTPTHRFDVV